MIMDTSFKTLKPNRRNLLIVCAGDKSLHKQWVNHRKTFDIITIYYGDDPGIAKNYQEISDIFFMTKGLKIELARNVLLRHMKFDLAFNFSHYHHIWFPDDDLEFIKGNSIEDLFDMAAIADADVFQPAVANENYSLAWEATRLIPNVLAHRTNIVEVMAHGFSGEIFDQAYLSAIHVCEFMKSGWGLEPIWMKIGEATRGRPLKTYVFDCIPVNHTRPVGSGDSTVHRLGRFEAQFIPQIHTNRMVAMKVYENLSQLRSDDDYDVFGNQQLIEQWRSIAFGNFRG
jgi:hypothetical protein